MPRKVIKTLGASNHTEEQREINDYYATDPQALLDFLKAFEEDQQTLSNLIWEPACGEGNIAKELIKKGHIVKSTDLIDRGFGKCQDFLKVSTDTIFDGDIVTNPPYVYSEDFVRRSLSIVGKNKKVIMLFKMQFVESVKRYKLFEKYPPRFIYVHSRRIKIWKNNTKSVPQALCYAWFVWQKGYKGATVLRWIK